MLFYEYEDLISIEEMIKTYIRRNRKETQSKREMNQTL